MSAESQDLNLIMEESASVYREKPYVIFLDEDRVLTFRSLNEYSNMVANFLRREGIEKGQIITLIGKNSIRTLILYFGILKLGAVVNPIFFEESLKNIERIVKMLRPEIIFLDADLRLENLHDMPGKLFVFSDDDTEPQNIFGKIFRYSGQFKSPEIGQEEGALVLITSGTTDVPKAVYITRKQLFYMIDEVSERIGLTSDDRVLEYRAFNWASVQLLTIWSCLYRGATLYLAKKFSRSRFVPWLKENTITISVGVPATINMLLNEPVPLRKSDVPYLRFMTSSSAPLRPQDQTQFENMYGIRINQMMGMTEAGWIAGNPPEAPKLGSVGTPMKHKEVYFLDESGGVCGTGKVGEMYVRGKSIGTGYLTGEGKILEFPREGFPTGDLGYVDDDGYIFITGRKKDLIIRGGINISPAEIDSWLMEHPRVVDAATVGVPDKIYGEEVVSFVVIKEGCTVSESELKMHCSARLPEFKAPKRILFLKRLPRNPNGKIIKTELLKIYEENVSA